MSDKYGLNRSIFPLEFNGHKLIVVNNIGRETSEDDDPRLFLNILVYCARCEDESSFRARFPPTDISYGFLSSVAKLYVLGNISHQCENDNQKAYII